MAIACVATEHVAALLGFLGVEAHAVDDAASTRRVLIHLLSEVPERYQAIFVEEAIAGQSLDLIRKAQESTMGLVTLFPGPTDDGRLGEERIREVCLWAVGVEM
jgi:vacuolar-type H+-ATPase subunit F/Vma7